LLRMEVFLQREGWVSGAVLKRCGCETALASVRSIEMRFGGSTLRHGVEPGFFLGFLEKCLLLMVVRGSTYCRTGYPIVGRWRGFRGIRIPPPGGHNAAPRGTGGRSPVAGAVVGGPGTTATAPSRRGYRWRGWGWWAWRCPHWRGPPGWRRRWRPARSGHRRWQTSAAGSSGTAGPPRW